MPVPPTQTPTCPQPLDPALAEFLGDSSFGQTLGCPRDEATTTPAGWQPFENGYMLRRKDLNLTYILGSDNTWFFTGDRWREGDMEYDPEIKAPNGLYQPVRGFGLAWRDQPGVQEDLGWGAAEEAGFMAVIQEFTNGTAWLNGDEAILFILYGDGTYEVML